MLILKTGMKHRLRRNMKKVCVAAFRTERVNYSSSSKAPLVPFCMTKRCCSFGGSMLYLRQAPFSEHICSPGYLQLFRSYSSDSREVLPNLTDLPVRTIPLFFAWPKALFLCYFVIQPRYDKDFSIQSFFAASEKVNQ